MSQAVNVNFVGNEPVRMTDHAAGYDLIAEGSYTIEPNAVSLVDTGTAVQLPEGYCGLIMARSSIAKSGLLLGNGVGLLDSDYTGNLKFGYRNVTDEDITIEHGTRIGQLLVLPFAVVNYQKVDSLEETKRGAGGFGSTEGTVK